MSFLRKTCFSFLFVSSILVSSNSAHARILHFYSFSYNLAVPTTLSLNIGNGASLSFYTAAVVPANGSFMNIPGAMVGSFDGGIRVVGIRISFRSGTAPSGLLGDIKDDVINYDSAEDAMNDPQLPDDIKVKIKAALAGANEIAADYDERLNQLNESVRLQEKKLEESLNNGSEK